LYVYAGAVAIWCSVNPNVYVSVDPPCSLYKNSLYIDNIH
jgi:hypothetical protein